jgi:hypothetical protein
LHKVQESVKSGKYCYYGNLAWTTKSAENCAKHKMWKISFLLYIYVTCGDRLKRFRGFMLAALAYMYITLNCVTPQYTAAFISYMLVIPEM